MKLPGRVKSYAPLLKSKKVFIPAVGVLVVAATLAVLNTKYTVAFQNGKLNFDQKHKQQESELATLPTVEAEGQAIKAGEKSKTKEEPDSAAAPTSDPQPIKYSTSSDPRSTAYSTTPPKPNQASVDIRITRPNQVKAGTLISYNATKKDGKTYYGGDLVFSPSNVTIHKGVSPNSQTFTAFLPGGKTAGDVNAPWYDSGTAVFVAYNSIGVFAALFNGAVPNGTYYLHVTTSTEAAGNITWQYDGFLPVVVTK